MLKYIYFLISAGGVTCGRDLGRDLWVWLVGVTWGVVRFDFFFVSSWSHAWSMEVARLQCCWLLTRLWCYCFVLLKTAQPSKMQVNHINNMCVCVCIFVFSCQNDMSLFWIIQLLRASRVLVPLLVPSVVGGANAQAAISLANVHLLPFDFSK